jgi:isopenicillin-N epimerase
MTRTIPEYSPLIEQWPLDKSIVFLNHGSFGACPEIVLKVQHELRQRMESEPLRFFIRDLDVLYFESKQFLAGLVGVSSSDLVFVRNATEGVNTVLNSIVWNRDERILITDHIYPACKNAVLFYAAKNGLKVDEVSIPYPHEEGIDVETAILERIKPDTRLLLLDHISSPTAMVFPVKQIADALKGTGTEILVDGAHAPGALTLNIEELGVQYYTGNCHKWLCAPKGAAFLWVHRDQQEQVFPLNISYINLKGNAFEEKFYWTGTQDPTAWLSIPAAVQTLEKISGKSITQIIETNHLLNIEASRQICKSLHIPIPYPGQSLSCMTAFPLPDLFPAPEPDTPDPLQERLFHEYHIEIPVTHLEKGQRFIRISCHLYNDISQYKYLSEVLEEIL